VNGPLLDRLRIPRRLSSTDARRVFDYLVKPSTSDENRGAVIMALSDRPDDGREWATLAAEMRARARLFRPPGVDQAVDLCGSGGAPRPSFNISTISALVVAASGLGVVKHGNRSARGPCGSSDLLIALGLPVDRSVRFPDLSFRKFGIAFLHAPLFHPATAAVGPARRRLGVPTIFNRLGPLTNPARLHTAVVGWGNIAQAPVVRDAMRRLQVRWGVTMTSSEGCDEFSPARPTRIHWWGAATEGSRTIHPEDLLPREDRRGVWGPLPPPAAAIEAERLLAGGGGARRGSILLTAGAALWAAGRVRTFRNGVERATEVLDEGAPERLLAELRALAVPFARSLEV
jgi:anthranilate phosphoribosyltransferase